MDPAPLCEILTSNALWLPFVFKCHIAFVSHRSSLPTRSYYPKENAAFLSHELNIEVNTHIQSHAVCINIFCCKNLDITTFNLKSM